MTDGPPSTDPRDIETGTIVYTPGLPWPHGYCDTTNAAVLANGDWMCVLGTCPGGEGSPGAPTRQREWFGRPAPGAVSQREEEVGPSLRPQLADLRSDR